MNKQKVKVFLLLFLFSIIGVSIFLFLNKNEGTDINTQKNEKDLVLEKKDQKDLVLEKKDQKDLVLEKKDDKNSSFLRQKNNFSKGTLAYKIINDKEMLDTYFYGKELDEEFCFEKQITKGSSVFDCFIPNKITLEKDINSKIDLIKGSYRNDEIINKFKNTDIKSLTNLQIFINNYGTETLKEDVFFKELKNKIKNNNFTKDDIDKGIYLYDFQADYKNSQELIKIKCNKYPEECLENQKADIIIKGTVKDNKGNPIKGAKINSLADDKYYVSDENGKFIIKTKEFSGRRLSFSAQKNGYIQNYFYYTTSFNLNKNSNNTIEIINDFILDKPKKLTVTETDTISVKKEKIIDKNSNYIYDYSDVIFYNKNGTIYNGKINIYTYFFDRENWTNLLSLEVFNDVKDYIGNGMKTYGMPYVIIFDDKGNELDVKSSTPIKVNGKILYQEELDKDFLSKIINEGFIGNGKKIYSGLFEEGTSEIFPFYWWLDRKTGKWYDEPIEILDKNLNFKINFYTIK